VITLVFVDWENLWIGLRCAGYSVEPAQVIRALLVAIDARPHHTRVVLVTQSHTPTSSEREAIRAAVTTQVGGLPEIRDTRTSRKNAADIEIGFLAGYGLRAWNPVRVVIASADADVVNVARLAKQMMSEAQVIVTSTRRPPGRRVAADRLEFLNLLDAGVSELPKPSGGVRPANDYDKAAWALLTGIHTYRHSGEAVALHSGATIEARAGRERVLVPTWWADIERPRDLWERIEDLDAVLHESQDIAYAIGSPTLFELCELLRERKKPLAKEAQRIVDALVTADLIRLDPSGRVVKRSTLREGIVFPMRRAVLAHLAEERTPVNMWKVADRHYKGAFTGTSKKEKDESWGLVNNALVQWKIVRSERVGNVAQWHLNNSDPFVIDTRSKAVAIGDCVPTGGATHEQIRDRLCADWYSARWLRVLADARVLRWNSVTRHYEPGLRRLREL
jgi:hypothetical protein